MRRNRRNTRRSSYPASPSSGASTLFQYSTARPPTGYSQNSWIQGSPAPPLPDRTDSARLRPARPPRSPLRAHVRRSPSTTSPSTDDNRLQVDVESSTNPDTDHEEGEGEGETPLYARSDWTRADQPPFRPDYQARPRTGYSESVYPETGVTGPVLPPNNQRQTPLYAQSDWASQYNPTPRPLSTNGPRLRPETGISEKWAEEPTAWSRSSYNPRKTGLGTVYEDEKGYEGYYDLDIHDTEEGGTAGSMMSVVDLNQLSALPRERGNPFDDIHSVYDNKGTEHNVAAQAGIGKPHRADTEARLLTPEAHQRLGRMSVAPARYTLPPSRRSAISPEDHQGINPYAPDGLKIQQHPTHQKAVGLALNLNPSSENLSFISRLKSTQIGRLYVTYRPFILPLLSLIGAMLLTLALQGPESGIGGFVVLENGAMGGKALDGKAKGAILGMKGWCQDGQENPVCRKYRKGDFISTIGSFQLPGPDSLQPTLSFLLTALTALTWLLSTYQLTSAFLHFFLLFGLSIPWDFFITSDPLPPLTGFIPSTIRPRPQAAEIVSDEEAIQKEVDLRVRTERTPYEAYGWVWWAWWAHRRGPVGHIFALAVGLIGVCTLGVAAGFYRQISGAAVEGKASLGIGLFIPLINILFTIDPVISAIRYTIHARYYFDIFNEPPSPTPAAILLPPNIKPMRHIRKTGAPSFFAPPAADEIPDGIRSETLFAADPLAPPLPVIGQPGVEALDAETVRWLAAYPEDTDLSSLIAQLRSGGESDDFVLSDVGLLYLRPGVDEFGEPEGDALLVPPAGQIREELLYDAHLEILSPGPISEEGEEGHWGPTTMADKLGQTFWWPGIEEACEGFVRGCARCNPRYAQGGMGEVELKPGMTPLPFTGMTQPQGEGITAMMTDQYGVGQSAMAAEMAFAMRKAEDEARRDALG